MKDPKLSTEMGCYDANCGFNNLHMTFGHDEYMALIIDTKNPTTMPKEAAYIIRYHSFYAWYLKFIFF